jgi:hypothetical protein
VVLLSRRGGVSARVRIIGWMLAVLTLAVAAVVFLTWQLLSARSDAAADAELAHESTKFHAYAGSPTAAPFDTPEKLLDHWLQTNLPDTSEAFLHDRRRPRVPPQPRHPTRTPRHRPRVRPADRVQHHPAVRVGRQHGR